MTGKCLNIAIMGHVDSGKTSLVKAFYQHYGGQVSTAAFDKNPDSQRRGITLDLGFSCYNTSLFDQDNPVEVQFCFVDCPGHASLFRAVIGAAQIIDCVVLVLDASKGFEIQSVEALALAEIVTKRLIIVLNKTDLIADSTKVPQFEYKCRRLLSEKTAFDGSKVQVVSTCVRRKDANKLDTQGLDELLKALKQTFEESFPTRSLNGPFMFSFDHVFHSKGHGMIYTGTVLSGQISTKDEVCLIEQPAVRFRIRSIQVFKVDVQRLQQGDRAALCLHKPNPQCGNRGVFVKCADVSCIQAMTSFVAVVHPTMNSVNQSIASRSKLYLLIGFEMYLCSVIFFAASSSDTKHLPQSSVDRQRTDVVALEEEHCMAQGYLAERLSGMHIGFNFDLSSSYEYLETFPCSRKHAKGTHPSPPLVAYAYIVLDQQRQILCAPNSLFFMAHLNLDSAHNASQGRLMLFGRLLQPMNTTDGSSEMNLKIIRSKVKAGSVSQVNLADNTVIGSGLFKSDHHVNAFLGHTVVIKEIFRGKILRVFGKRGKCLIGDFNQKVTSDMLHQPITLQYCKTLEIGGLHSSILKAQN